VTSNAATVLREALALPLDERADVAAELLASLGPVDEPDGQELWKVELERRARRALSGDAPGEDWATLRERLANRFTG